MMQYDYTEHLRRLVPRCIQATFLQIIYLYHTLWLICQTVSIIVTEHVIFWHDVWQFWHLDNVEELDWTNMTIEHLRRAIGSLMRHKFWLFTPPMYKIISLYRSKLQWLGRYCLIIGLGCLISIYQPVPVSSMYISDNGIVLCSAKDGWELPRKTSSYSNTTLEESEDSLYSLRIVRTLWEDCRNDPLHHLFNYFFTTLFPLCSIPLSIV